jgi:predicted transcriptional regulator
VPGRDDLDHRIVELANAFLVAYREVETKVKGLALPPKDPSRFRSMGDALGQLPPGSPAAPYVTRLRELAKLRNALSHENGAGDLPVAAPLPATVAEIQAIRDLLLNPPTLGEFVKDQRLVAADMHQPIIEVLAAMRTGDFSQAPVLGTDRLFTTNAVARWVTDRLTEDDLILAEHATVEAILAVAEPHEYSVAMPTETSLATAYEVLRRSVRGETVGPVAVLTTDYTGEIVGVAVHADLSHMSAALGL